MYWNWNIWIHGQSFKKWDWHLVKKWKKKTLTIGRIYSPSHMPMIKKIEKRKGLKDGARIQVKIYKFPGRNRNTNLGCGSMKQGNAEWQLAFGGLQGLKCSVWGRGWTQSQTLRLCTWPFPRLQKLLASTPRNHDLDGAPWIGNKPQAGWLTVPNG